MALEVRLLELRVRTELCRQTYSRVRPHGFLGFRSPAPEVLMPADTVSMLVFQGLST